MSPTHNCGSECGRALHFVDPCRLDTSTNFARELHLKPASGKRILANELTWARTSME